MKCEICGNEYDKSFEVIKGGQRHIFDSMECAIQGIAPICDFCGVRIVGHGMGAASSTAARIARSRPASRR